MNDVIDLRSDTVTKPTHEMIDFMFKAKVGDDVFREDPSINELEEMVAMLFDMETALFCPSGTMTNQIAIKVHTQPGDEVICYENAHVYKYEGGGIAMNSGASTKLIKGNRGILSPKEVEESIKADDVHFPKTSLVCLENTVNFGGGNCYSIEEMKSIKTICEKHNLKLHLDGARLFNAIIAKEYYAKEIGNEFDSISICLSKGLGSPMGSLLLGKHDFIEKARRVRKAFGGGMRQIGYMAAAGIYALDNNIDRLKEDHLNAKKMANALHNSKYVSNVESVETNIILFDLKEEIPVETYLNQLEKQNILAFGIGEQRIRFVTHLDVTDEMINKVCEVV